MSHIEALMLSLVLYSGPISRFQALFLPCRLSFSPPGSLFRVIFKLYFSLPRSIFSVQDLFLASHSGSLSRHQALFPVRRLLFSRYIQALNLESRLAFFRTGSLSRLAMQPLLGLHREDNSGSWAILLWRLKHQRFVLECSVGHKTHCILI